jgi:diacylglycerol kinase family enzyme
MPAPRTNDDAPIYIVSNAASGSGDAVQARDEIARVLDDAGRRHEFLLIEDPEQVPKVASEAAERAAATQGIVVAAGGDGTINAVAQATLPTGRPFGIVPQGTFNYTSRAHAISADPAEAARLLVDGRLKPVQVGTLNERIFLVNASLGLYPELMEDREALKRQYGRRRSIALWAGLTSLLRNRRQLALEISYDGQQESVRTPTLFIGNNPLQLEQVGLPEAEDVQQWRLAAVIVRPVSTAQLVWLGVRGALGQLGDDDRIRNFAFQRMTVLPVSRSATALKVAIDGEVCWMRPPLTFALAQQPLWLFVPKSAPPA